MYNTIKKINTESLKPRSHYKRHSATKQHDPIHFNGGLAVSGDTSHSDHWRPNGGVSSNVTKFRILQLYANEEQFAGATANRIEDGWAHVILLLSAKDKHTQWKKVCSVSHSFLFVCTDLIHIYIIFSILPPKCLYVVAKNLICCQGNQ